MAATLDGRVQSSEAVFEAKFMLPWSFSEEGAAEKSIRGAVIPVSAISTSIIVDYVQ